LAYGSGWEIEESDRYLSNYEEHIAGSPTVEDMIEGFIWALRADPTAGPVRKHVVGNF